MTTKKKSQSKKTSRKTSKKTTKKVAKKSAKKTAKRTTSKITDLKDFNKLKMHRFAGVSLAGGKSDKTAVAVLEYYPSEKKLFLRDLHDSIKASKEKSSDFYLHNILEKVEKNLELIAFDAPLKLPKCMRCKLKCPGYELCKEPEIKWMWKIHKKRSSKKRPNKIFTPYTERCAEAYISNELEEQFFPPAALGANGAPLAARAMFLSRRLKSKTMEFYPKLSLWRIGCDLRIQKSYLRFHRHAIDSDECREFVVRQLVENEVVFVYQQDMKLMIDRPHAFDAFLGALTAYLKFMGRTEKKPTGFPKSEAWVEFPKVNVEWF